MLSRMCALQVQAVISDQAAFTTYGDVVAFVGQA